VVGSTLGGVAIGLGGYSWLAVLTLLGRLGAAALALPISLARRR